MKIALAIITLTLLLSPALAQQKTPPPPGPARPLNLPKITEKKLPNGWRYTLSYQKYYSAEMVCYEGKGVPVDIELLNRKSDISDGSDPLITRALEVLRSE